MGRIFNVLVPVIVLSAYFRGGSGSCDSDDSQGISTGGTFCGSGSLSGGASWSGANGGSSGGSGTGIGSGTGNGNGLVNSGNGMAKDGFVYGTANVGDIGNSASSWGAGYSGNGAAYGSGSATGDGLYSNSGNGGAGLAYAQGGDGNNGGSYGQRTSATVSGGNGGIVQYGSHSSGGLLREVAGDIADTVVDVIEVGHSLMHRPYVRQGNVQYVRPGYVRQGSVHYVRPGYVRQSNVHYARPGYVHQVVRLPSRVVSVHRGCGH